MTGSDFSFKGNLFNLILEKKKRMIRHVFIISSNRLCLFELNLYVNINIYVYVCISHITEFHKV